MTQTTVEKIERVSIDKIVPAGHNRPAKNLDGLVESIKSVGILQPPVVTSNGKPGEYQLVMGHRRHAAAKAAGLTEIDVIVRTQDEVSSMKSMLVENLHRDDLDPTEEAAGYALLMGEHGMTQQQVAESIGVSQPHVSKRIALLTLPKPVFEALRADKEDDRLPLEGAHALTRIKDPKAIESVWKAAKSARYPENIVQRVELAVDQYIAEDEKRRKAVATKKTLRARGIKILPADKYPSSWGDKPSAFIGKGERKLAVPPKDHEAEPCHAAYVDDGGRARPVCTEPARHKPKGASKLKGLIETVSQSSPRKAAGESEEERKRKELEAKFDELRDAREEFVTAVLSKRVTKDDALELVTAQLLADGWGTEIVLDAEPALKILTGSDVKAGDLPMVQNTARLQTLRKLCEASPQNQARLAAVAVIVGVEQTIADVFDWNGKRESWAECAFYFDWLKRKGYEISVLEQEQLDLKEARPR